MRDLILDADLQTALQYKDQDDLLPKILHSIGLIIYFCSELLFSDHCTLLS